MDKPPRVLIVDEYDDWLKLLELVVLRDLPGVNVQCCGSVHAADRAIAAQPPDLIIADITLRQLSPRHLTAWLQFPLLVVTATRVTKLDFPAGVPVHILYKPFSLEAFTAALHASLQLANP